jgi:hypothetical protein
VSFALVVFFLPVEAMRVRSLVGLERVGDAQANEAKRREPIPCAGLGNACRWVAAVWVPWPGAGSYRARVSATGGRACALPCCLVRRL